MKVHILGICGTFMGGIAALARELGHEVSGNDQNVYPPMSTQLNALGIKLTEGYEDLPANPDVFVIGNALSRGNPALEQVLESGIPYTSGPEWLAHHLLTDRHVLAVAGTHGKTTTSSLLAWLLEDAGLEPGFLIGGVPGNFGVSARLGRGPFVVEADEYDTAFFDKRSKFVHYRPRTLILNNLEFDHADIFDDLAAIERQFHHLIRTVPGSGRIICNADDANLARVLKQGCWSELEYFGSGKANWSGTRINDEIGVRNDQGFSSAPAPALLGQHNLLNALAAIAAANHVGVNPESAVNALSRFRGVKRRLEYLGEFRGTRVYDDFAHHPTAIRTTLDGLRESLTGPGRLWVALEPRSNSMRAGAHNNKLASSLEPADGVVVLKRPDLAWSVEEVLGENDQTIAADSVDEMLEHLGSWAAPGDIIVFMSNGGFDGAQRKLFDT